jgi:hypothetical protein
MNGRLGSNSRYAAVFMKCNLHHSFRNKNKGVHVTAIAPLLIMALSILAVCDLAADGQDRITITNRSSGEIALWVSQTQTNSIESTVMRRTTEGNIFTGSFTGQPGAVIAYANNRSPTLRVPAPWTSGIDSVRMRLDKIHRIRLVVWIVNVGNHNDFLTVKENALRADERVSMIWEEERQGIEFRRFEIKDATGKTDANGESVPEKFRSEAFNCGRASEIMTDIGFTPNAINVYYVETVEVEGVSGSTFGEYCGAENLIALGADSDDALLAHELGHAFSLEHVEHLDAHFDKTNVMHARSDERNFLTEGQTFRAIANKGSAINTLYHARSQGAPEIQCVTVVDLKQPDCPPIQKRIWRDGGENGTSWDPNE